MGGDEKLVSITNEMSQRKELEALEATEKKLLQMRAELEGTTIPNDKFEHKIEELRSKTMEMLDILDDEICQIHKVMVENFELDPDNSRYHQREDEYLAEEQIVYEEQAYLDSRDPDLQG